MALKGSFERRISNRVNGVVIYSFILTNTDWFGSETFDCMLCDGAGQQPWYYRDQKIKAGEAIRFDFDTIGWSWCQGDFFAILGRKEKVEKKWQLQLKEYRKGECPECHGSHKCGHCNGNGFSFNFNSSVIMCPFCGGTGVCQACDIPRRKQSLTAPPSSPYMGSVRTKRHRPIEIIQNEINDVRRQIEQIEWNWKVRDVKDHRVSHSLFQSENQLRYTLKLRLTKLEQELAAAYNG